MKVFYCECQGSYAGGVILVAAYTKEQAIITAARDKSTKDLFWWCNYEADKDYNLAKDDGNIKHLHSYVYPPKDWFELNHLHTDLAMPHVILEDGFSE